MSRTSIPVEKEQLQSLEYRILFLVEPLKKKPDLEEHHIEGLSALLMDIAIDLNEIVNAEEQLKAVR